ncbi:ATP-binding protein [Streptomyces sclerotialus]|uniref:ATP-binding protein n=1 Tax=Streptomyces sclerotialus TaxID=1957 RepID=UPI00068BEEBC
MGNLPVQRGRLIGRRPELAQVARLLRRSRLVTVTGVGGVGKTRLAQHAAAEVQPHFADGAWWVELSPVSQGPGLPYAIAEALPLTDQTTRPMLEVVAEYLACREALLVWDTCEHLVADCREAAATLLTVAPRLRILVTSRRPLGLPAEDTITLDPLPVPEADDAAAEDNDAVQLLAERAAAAVPGFTVTPANRSELVALCRRLEGLPLAIELAAARLREMPPAELNRRLDDRYAVLGETEQAVHDAYPPWHQALRTAIGWSHQQCTPAERLAWARLSVFAGTFDTDSACRVLADEHLSAQDVPRLLAALVQDSILEWTPTGAGERYRMLDTLREFGAFWLRGLGEERAVRRRHRDHYLALAHAADAAWVGPEQVAWYDRTVADHANLRTALDFCLAEEDGHSALELGGALWFFWSACGFVREGRHYLDQALDLGPAPGPARAKTLWACGLAAIAQGDAEASLRLAGLFRETVAGESDGTAQVAAAYLEGASLTISGHQTQAAEALDAVPHAPPRRGRYDMAWFVARATRAFVHVHLGQFADALAVAEDVCTQCVRREETWARAWGDYTRALAALGLGRTEEAAAHARAALDGKRPFHDSLGIAMTIDLLASTAVASGCAERAARLLGIAERIWHTIGTPQMGSPELVAARSACEAQARRLIGDDAYRTAFRSGYATAPAAGIAYALSVPDPPHPATVPGRPG